MGWIVRTSVAPENVSSAVQDIIRQTTGVPVTNVQNMEDIVSINISRQRLNMLLMTIFGGSALVLAAIGIYGLMAYSVQHRTQEIGIRMALGAQADRVRWGVVGQGMTLVGIGIVVGVLAAFFLATFLASVLYGVQARDVMVFVGVPTVLAATAFAAVWIAGAACGAASIRSTLCATNSADGTSIDPLEELVGSESDGNATSRHHARLADVSREQAVHGDGARRVDAWHRRQHRHLLGRQCRVVEADGIRRARFAGATGEHESRGRRETRGVAGEVHALARTDRCARERGGVPRYRSQSRARRRAGSHSRRPDVGRVLRRVPAAP